MEFGKSGLVLGLTVAPHFAFAANVQGPFNNTQAAMLGICLVGYTVMLGFIVGLASYELIRNAVTVGFPKGWARILEWLRGERRPVSPMIPVLVTLERDRGGVDMHR